MEIKIEVTKKNKDKILKLLSELIDSEVEGSVGIGFGRNKENEVQTNIVSRDNYLSPPSNVNNLEFGKPNICKSPYGAFAMFNSYIPGKASLRILAHLMAENKGKPIKYKDLIAKCVEIYEKTGLSKYRGFPNVGKKKKESSISRLEWHLIYPFDEMGLIQIREENFERLVSITREGLDFARIPNLLLDEGHDKSVLSDKEKEWLVEYLEKIESDGFEEYSVLSNLVEFLKTGKKNRQDIINWFMENKKIVDFIRESSRYKNDDDQFSKQLQNLCSTFVAGKIALLRELGTVLDKRGDYSAIKNLK